MISNEFLQIRYDAFPVNDDIEDFENIELFKKEINDNYNSIVKANSVGRGGGAYELIIHFIASLTLSEYLKIAARYLGQKALDKITDSSLENYIFTPLHNAYKNLKSQNPILDCHSFKLEFDDITVFVYKTSENSLLANLSKLIEELHINLEKLREIENYKASEIHIPVLLDTENNHQLFRTPMGTLETINTLSDSNYFNFWGIKYCSNQLSTVYDLNKKVILEGSSFYTEEEFQINFRNNE